MSGAVVRGEVAETPAWRSTRGATFQRTFDGEVHPWLLEDLQLRWKACADFQERALELGARCRDRVAAPYRASFGAFLDELAEFRRRVLSYVFHCRETNLATLIRTAGLSVESVPERVVAELADVMRQDLANGGPEALTEALAALERSPLELAAKWFIPPQTGDFFGHSDASSYRARLFRRTGWDAPLGMHSATSGSHALG